MTLTMQRCARAVLLVGQQSSEGPNQLTLVLCIVMFGAPSLVGHDAVNMQSASSHGVDHRANQLGRLSLHCQQQLPRRKLSALLCTARTTCVSRPLNRRPADQARHWRNAHLEAARQRRQHAPARTHALAASDAHSDILSIVYDEQQIAAAVSKLGRWEVQSLYLRHY
jgi:hypothetical protein